VTHTILDTGGSRSFPTSHPFLEAQQSGADIVVVIGTEPGQALKSVNDAATKRAILVELGTESLGTHTGESRGSEGSNVLGFARFRLGDSEPSLLIELVRQPRTSVAAISAAIELLQAAGFQVALCNDFEGRIIDRLVRPYYNAALRRLDEGLATADDMDMTLRLGLGHPDGPIALLERTGLAHHFDISLALFEATGEQAYAPARRARVAKTRQQRKGV